MKKSKVINLVFLIIGLFCGWYLGRSWQKELNDDKPYKRIGNVWIRKQPPTAHRPEPPKGAGKSNERKAK